MSQYWPPQTNNQPRSSNHQGPSQYYNSPPANNRYNSNNQGFQRNNYPPQTDGRYANYQNYPQYNTNQPPSRGNGQNNHTYYLNSKPYSRGSELDEEDQQYLSRQLSSILRHRAPSMKLNIDSGGFVPVDEILRLGSFRNASLNDIKKIVEKDNKQRFHLKMDDKLKCMVIRANQGHSFELEKLELKEILDASEYPTVLHGTYYESWKKIRTQGLKTMQRNHIHFAADMPGSSGVISGMRQSCEIIVYLNLEKALKDGLKFYLSKNNVILSSGNEKYVIEPQYFEKVVDYETGRHLSLTEPVETSSTKSSSNISERVAAREAGIKETGKPNNYPPGFSPIDDTSSEKTKSKDKKGVKPTNVVPGLNPVDDTSSEKTESKDKRKKKKKNKKRGSKDNDMAERAGESMKASKTQETIITEPKEEVCRQKQKGSSETTSYVNVDQKDKDWEEETVKKSRPKRKEKKVEQELSLSEDEEKPVTRRDTEQSENGAMILQQFDPVLKQELLELKEIAVLAQAKVLAVGNMDKLIVFDREKKEDIDCLQKIMNSQNILKLITQMTSCKMPNLVIKQFQKVLDLNILYNEMNEKPINGNVKALYEKATGNISNSSPELDIKFETLKMGVHYRKAASFVQQACGLYKYYERLDPKTQRKIFDLSLAELKKTLAKKD